MTETIAHRLRSILRRSSQPMPVSALAERLGERQQAVANALSRMVDAYVARWSINMRGKYVREWAVVRTPPNAPKPTKPNARSQANTRPRCSSIDVLQVDSDRTYNTARVEAAAD